ncbi:MAG: 1-deoxy-D-xylulose-5-phosphate reductoisomerase, partial [Pseudomonadota bacterium]
MRKISIFGSTGSVGENTIKVLEAQDEKFDIQVLTANENAPKLADQAKRLKPQKVVIANDEKYNELKGLLSDTNIGVEAGHDALIDAASMPSDWTMAAIVGMAGIKPLMKAIEQGNNVAIANKEPLVAAGPIIMQLAKKHGTTLLPIDSEHNAIFQVFEKDNQQAIERLILTASGGPFREFSMEELQNVTAEQALNHPNWSMGSKISIDSATMMNKALEVIEAEQLFSVSSNQIDVLVHPQSVVHSMVEYSDGSVLAQMGAAD